MKYLLVLAVVLTAIWIWRHRRDEERRDAPPPRRPDIPPTPALMVACRHCGVHLPRDQAIAGRLGHYCSAEHLRLGEPQR
ncbi:MAG: hypothetical protein RJA36_2385 [Pseudomonadota bacterium]|jgi:uncharacterized protein